MKLSVGVSSLAGFDLPLQNPWCLSAVAGRLVCSLAASEECVGSVGTLLCAFPIFLSV